MKLFRSLFKKMTWRARGTNNIELITQMKEYGVIASDAVAEAMIATDRKFYSPSNPYMDAPQGIGYGVTISAPHMHAFALEYLRDHLTPGAHVLDVGSGSGYLTACFYRYMQAKEDNVKTRVVGIEHQPELVRQSQINLNNDDPKMLQSEKVIIVGKARMTPTFFATFLATLKDEIFSFPKEGDGRKGCPKYAPYNAIHVGAAAPDTPTDLIKQLAKGGRLIVPVGPDGGQQYMMQYDKNQDGSITKTRLLGVMYVPLTDLQR